MKPHFIFDFDSTLVNSSCLRDYFTTSEGKEYVISHASEFPTTLAEPQICDLIYSAQKFGKVSVLTNANEHYARTFLDKHSFPRLNVVGNAKKPLAYGLELLLENSGISKEQSILIGDSPHDILAAHASKIVSVGVTWGAFSSEYLTQSEPQKLVKDVPQLVEVLNTFLDSKISYKERDDPKNHFFVKEDTLFKEDFPIISLDTYYPPVLRKGDEFSSDILRYKTMKNFTVEEINKGARDVFFYNSSFIHKKKFLDVFFNFSNRITEKIQSLNLKGSTLLLSAPNSFPEYCYQFDVNHIFTKVVASSLNFKWYESRLLRRVYPKEEAHNLGSREEKVHYRTIGYKLNEKLVADNILLFDDVTTSGSQIKSLGAILRAKDFRGNLYGLALSTSF